MAHSFSYILILNSWNVSDKMKQLLFCSPEKGTVKVLCNSLQCLAFTFIIQMWTECVCYFFLFPLSDVGKGRFIIGTATRPFVTGRYDVTLLLILTLPMIASMALVCGCSNSRNHFAWKTPFKVLTFFPCLYILINLTGFILSLPFLQKLVIAPSEKILLHPRCFIPSQLSYSPPPVYIH